MKVRIKQTKDSINALYRDCVPLVVIEQIIGKEVNAVWRNNDIVIEHPFVGEPAEWIVAPECVEFCDPQAARDEKEKAA